MEKTRSFDNIIWQALSTRLSAFAQSFGAVKRFVSDVGPLAALKTYDDEGYESLTELASTDIVALFLNEPWQPRAGWQVTSGAPLVRMVKEDDASNISNMTLSIVPLNKEQMPDMLSLATLTKPGPFGTRTHELGNFFGIYHEGLLAAMAGERLKIPGYTEISAVCTHPSHLGKGYASALTQKVADGIAARGETAFLHVRGDNQRAIDVYARLGFCKQWSGYFVALQRT